MNGEYLRLVEDFNKPITVSQLAEQLEHDEDLLVEDIIEMGFDPNSLTPANIQFIKEEYEDVGREVDNEETIPNLNEADD